jgi:cobyrinic acid a,c-diamide synthase
VSLRRVPRVVVAGTSGDSGKTLVSLALVLAARDRGLDVRAFKKGPDYIDAAWLAWASDRPARNLDTFLAGPEAVLDAFTRHAAVAQDDGTGAINLVEGNRGIFDGMDAAGTHSTAALARLIDAPVVLVVNARKMTGTTAAFVRGCQALDPTLRIAGVVLNHVASHRHAAVAGEAVEQACGVRVLGAIPRLGAEDVLPGRHLGLVPPGEHRVTAALPALLRRVASEHLDVPSILAASDLAWETQAGPGRRFPRRERRARTTVGYVADAAFSFYYPDNLEALEACGATLVKLSSLASDAIPDDLDALYIGGGFPETHGEELERNRAFLSSLRAAAARQLPIYAECGGLMLLASSVAWQGRRRQMAGVLPIDIEVSAVPQGHGYMSLRVDRANPFYPTGLEIRAHEFHYSRITSPLPPTGCAVLRGTGCGAGRDAIVAGSVWASYAHVHATGTPEWADGVVAAARQYARSRPGP